MARADEAGIADPTARLMNELGLLLNAKALHAEAEPLYRRALAINERRLGPDHPDVAPPLNNLAGLLRDTNRAAEAEPLFRRALAIGERSYGPDHPEVATVLNNLALLLRDTNRAAEAEPLGRRAVAIFSDFTRRTGHEHPHLRVAIDVYRRILGRMGRSEADIEADLAKLMAEPR